MADHRTQNRHGFPESLVRVAKRKRERQRESKGTEREPRREEGGEKKEVEMLLLAPVMHLTQPEFFPSL